MDFFVCLWDVETSCKHKYCHFMEAEKDMNKLIIHSEACFCFSAADNNNNNNIKFIQNEGKMLICMMRNQNNELRKLKRDGMIIICVLSLQKAPTTSDRLLHYLL